MSNPEKEEKRAQLRAARIEEMRQYAEPPERLKNDQDRMRQLVGVSMILENKKKLRNSNVINHKWFYD